MSCFSETGLKVNTKAGYAATGTPDTVGYSYEGFMTPEMRFERRLMFKEYELKDHLGNVRLVFGDATVADAAGETQLDVRALSNYYPFGMLQPHRYYQDAGYTNSRQGFNGMEKDDDVKTDEGQHYDFGARAYDPRVGRFLSLDKFRAKYPDISPFSFAANSPNIFMDDNGDSIYVYTNNKAVYVALDLVRETQIGKMVIDKYMNSPNEHVHIGVEDLRHRASKGLSLNGTGNQRNKLIKNGLTDFPNSDQSDFAQEYSQLNQIKVKPGTNHFVIFCEHSFNPEINDNFLDVIFSYNGTEDNAETVFHEFFAHLYRGLDAQLVIYEFQLNNKFDYGEIEHNHLDYGDPFSSFYNVKANQPAKQILPNEQNYPPLDQFKDQYDQISDQKIENTENKYKNQPAKQNGKAETYVR